MQYFIQTTSTHQIPAHRYDELQQTVTRINKHAKRLGLGDVASMLKLGDSVKIVTVYPPQNDATQASGKRPYNIEVPAVDISLTTTACALGGYSLIAVVERLADENLFRAVEGAAAERELEPFRSRGFDCDHCGMQRRRNECYVVRAKDGSLSMVGSSCLQYLIGSRADAEQIAELLPFLAHARLDLEDGFEDWSMGSNRNARHRSLKMLLCFVAEDVSKNGFKARKNCADDEICTGQAADLDLCKAERHGDHKLLDAVLTKHGEQVEQCIAYWAAISTITARNDYEANLGVIARARACGARSVNTAASMLPSWQRAVGEAEAAKCNPSQHVGTVGKRLRDVTLTLQRLHDFSGQYVKIMHVFVDGNGNVVKWFSSGAALEVGGVYLADMTVKLHGEYKGVKETVVTRVAAQRVEAKVAA